MSDDRTSLKHISDQRTALLGVASVVIMILHYYQILGAAGDGVLKNLVVFTADMCNSGVDIFLLLSGMGLYYSLEKDPRILPFYGRRFIRIMPEFALILIGFAFAYSYTPLDIIRLLTGEWFWVTGNLTDWYMALLIVLYLIYPLIHKILKKSIGAVLTVTAVIMIAEVILSIVLKDGLPRSVALARVPVFIVGAVIGRLIKEGKTKVKGILFALAGLISFGICDIILVLTPNSTITRLCYIVIAFTVALYGGAILSRLKDTNIIKKGLEALGKISLPFYLINMRTTIWMRSFEAVAQLPKIVQILLTLIISLIFSIACKFICDKLRQLPKYLGKSAK